MHFFNVKGKLLLCTLCSIIFWGCDKFLEISPPKNELIKTVVFSSNATANAAILSIYAQMSSDGNFAYRLPYYTGLAGDELLNYSTEPDILQVYTNSVFPLNSKTLLFWQYGYSYIYQANAVLEALEISNIDDKLRKQLTGEALFFRAFSYYYLSSLFGDVPIVKSTLYSANASIKRSLISDVKKSIIADLVEAKSILDSNFVGDDGLKTSVERVRITRWAATALLARVYLDVKEYERARVEASSVISYTRHFALDSNLAAVFLKNGREAIWQLQPSVPGYNTMEGNGFILIAQPSGGDVNSATLADSLVRSFEAGDKRFINWIGVLKVAGKDYYYPAKYKVRASSTVSEYSTVLRLGEMYLVRAEASAYLADYEMAREDLNVVRKRAGLFPLTGLNNGNFSTRILQERRSEFFCEWGHRWLDLKRLGKVDSIMPQVLKMKSGAEWRSDKSLWPIPQVDRDKNSNLSQNPGYN